MAGKRVPYPQIWPINQNVCKGGYLKKITVRIFLKYIVNKTAFNIKIKKGKIQKL
jgi:hypothetical protein